MNDQVADGVIVSSENAPHVVAGLSLGARGDRPEGVEPFLRGVPFPGTVKVPYPRVDLLDRSRVPGDTWRVSCLPVGVRLEVVGDATHLEITYTAETDQLGYRGPGAGTDFISWAVPLDGVAGGVDGGVEVGRVPAVVSAGMSVHPTVLVPLGGADARTIIFLPEGMKPTVKILRPRGGTVSPAPRQPRWVVYGDSVAEGWIATQPALSWPAIAGRLAGVDHTNLSFAGAARGELPMAEQIGKLGAEILTVCHGTNCWTRTPHSVAQMAANTEAFLDVLRQDHPDVPILVVSPVVRPDAESTPNRLGATLADLRGAMHDVVRTRQDGGDAGLHLLDGMTLMGPELLGDGIHPDDDGHRAVGALVAAEIRRILT